MARVAGVDIPNKKKVEIGLTSIFGVGRPTSRKILNDLNISFEKRIGDLTEEEIASIRTYLDGNIKVEGDLRKEIALNIKRLVEINCFRGVRHRTSMPVRGQKTRSNARTRRGLAGKRGIKKK